LDSKSKRSPADAQIPQLIASQPRQNGILVRLRTYKLGVLLNMFRLLDAAVPLRDRKSYTTRPRCRSQTALLRRCTIRNTYRDKSQPYVIIVRKEKALITLKAHNVRTTDIDGGLPFPFGGFGNGTGGRSGRWHLLWRLRRHVPCERGRWCS
jgi:hypothetical protein